MVVAQQCMTPRYMITARIWHQCPRKASHICPWFSQRMAAFIQRPRRFCVRWRCERLGGGVCRTIGPFFDGRALQSVLQSGGAQHAWYTLACHGWALKKRQCCMVRILQNTGTKLSAVVLWWWQTGSLSGDGRGKEGTPIIHVTTCSGMGHYHCAQKNFPPPPVVFVPPTAPLEGVIIT